MGLNKDTPFVIGASDGVLSNLGVNSVGKGESCCHNRYIWGDSYCESINRVLITKVEYFVMS